MCFVAESTNIKPTKTSALREIEKAVVATRTTGIDYQPGGGTT